MLFRSLHIFVTNESITEAVKGFIKEKTRLNSQAFDIVVIEEIPKNDSGKIQYKELEKYYVV